MRDVIPGVTESEVRAAIKSALGQMPLRTESPK
jgi:hypothetical protein